MMRLLVTGRNGQVATSLAERAAAHPGIEVLALGRPELDLENPATVEAAIAAARPDLVVNAAAYTAVDKAESDSGRAFAANPAFASVQRARRRDPPCRWCAFQRPRHGNGKCRADQRR